MCRQIFCNIFNISIDENSNFCRNFSRASEIFGYEAGNLETSLNLKNFYFKFKQEFPDFESRLGQKVLDRFIF